MTLWSVCGSRRAASEGLSTTGFPVSSELPCGSSASTRPSYRPILVPSRRRDRAGSLVCADVPAYSQVFPVPFGYTGSQSCYDLSPLAKPRFDRRTAASSGPHSGALTGGVCKEQGRIHRVLLRRDYYRIQLHEGEFQPSIRTTTGFRRLAVPLGIASHCPGHCSPRVARPIRGILTYRCPFLPPL